MSKTPEQETAIKNLKFEINLWIRYYDMRRAFFSAFHMGRELTIPALILVVFIGSTAENIAVPITASILALVIFIGTYLFGMHDVLMGGFAGAVSFHDRMYRSFINLKIEMLDEEQYDKVRKKMYDIFESPMFFSQPFRRAIWVCAYNQTCAACGIPEKYYLTKWQRMMANILPMRATTFKVISDISAIPDIRLAYF